jgi:HAD superfamily hydrolase (TIGR01549 family)
MRWQAVFFDFDGVILDSVNVKTRAFALIFRPFGAKIEKKVVEYHLANGGISRFEKFRYFYEKFLEQTISEEKIIELSDRFSALVVQEVLKSHFIEGALETLDQLRQLNVPMFVVSGTPHEEIQDIVQKRDLAHYFIEVHGSPRKKEQIIHDIITRYKFEPANSLFIGDSIEDYYGAIANGLRFLGIAPKEEKSIFPPETNVLTKVSL